MPKVPGFDQYSALEMQSGVIRKYEALVVAGLLQIEDYARVVCTSDQRTPDQTERMVLRRMERQTTILDREDRSGPPRLFIVQSEHALRAPVAPPEIMRKQYAHLLKVASRPRVHLQIVPEDAGYHDGRAGAFTVLSFERGAFDVAYIESGGYGHVIEHPDAVASFAEQFELIRNVALTTSDTLGLITSLLENST